MGFSGSRGPAHSDVKRTSLNIVRLATVDLLAKQNQQNQQNQQSYIQGYDIRSREGGSQNDVVVRDEIGDSTDMRVHGISGNMYLGAPPMREPKSLGLWNSGVFVSFEIPIVGLESAAQKKKKAKEC